MTKSLVVLSGGMDSAAALGYMIKFNKSVIGAVHFQYGSKHNPKEMSAVNALTSFYNLPLFVIELPFMNQLFKSDLLKSGGEVPEGHYEDESMKRTVVPFRNGIMLSIAAGLAESLDADAVVLGNHYGDHAIYPDCRKDFIEPMKEAIRAGTYKKIELYSPFVSMTKTQIASIGNILEVPFHLTWSCYKGGEKHCGKCGTCTERIEAFKLANVKDPTVYE